MRVLPSLAPSPGPRGTPTAAAGRRAVCAEASGNDLLQDVETETRRAANDLYDIRLHARWRSTS